MESESRKERDTLIDSQIFMLMMIAGKRRKIRKLHDLERERERSEKE